MDNRLNSGLISILCAGLLCTENFGCEKQNTKKEREISKNIWSKLDKDVYKKEPPKSAEKESPVGIPDSRIHGRWAIEGVPNRYFEITPEFVLLVDYENGRTSKAKLNYKFKKGKINIYAAGSILYRDREAILINPKRSRELKRE